MEIATQEAQVAPAAKAVIAQYPDGYHIIVTRYIKGFASIKTYRCRTLAGARKFAKEVTGR